MAKRKQPTITTQREASVAISAICYRIQREAMSMQAISRRFWVTKSPIGICPFKIYDYAKELEGYMKQFHKW